MRSLLAAAMAFVVLDASPAWAAIRIIDSNYENGITTVTGQTRSHQKVTLDGQYTTMSDGGGHFEFHVKYKPDTCLVSIVVDEDNYSALLTGCLASDAAADAARTGVSPPPSTAK
jgi:hypothetical protein